MSIPEDGQLYFLSTIFHPSGTENIIYARLPRLGCAVVHAVLQLGFMDTKTSSWERNVQCETSNEWAKCLGGETSRGRNKMSINPFGINTDRLELNFGGMCEAQQTAQ